MLPLSFCKLEVQPVYHKTVFIFKNLFCAHFLWRTFEVLFDRVQWNVLKYGTTKTGLGKCIMTTRRYSRELVALLDLTLQMSLLIQQVLQPEIGLIHVMARLSSSLFVRASGSIGRAVQRL